MKINIQKIFLVLACSVAGFSSIALAQPGAGRNSFEQVTDNIYRASNGFWHNLIYVTPEGIVLVDTLNPTFSSWLKSELDTRFPDLDVKYVIYSHSHFDHSEGGAVFADTATFIAQKNMWKNLDGRYPHMPGDMIDRNGNGMMEEEEFRIPWDYSPGNCGYPWLGEKDTDGDGSLSMSEFFADVVRPDIVYDEFMSLQIGGKTIELYYPGRNHGDDMTVTLFKDEGLIFNADFLADALTQNTMHSLPSACGPFDGHTMDEWIESYKNVEALDFDILTTGHGRPLRFTKQDVTDTRIYFEYLRDIVSEAIDQGLTLEEMQETLLMEPYADWDQYEQLRDKNIEAAYRNLTEIYPQ